MIAFICKACGGKQYSAARTNEPCIYCGKGPVVPVSDRQEEALALIEIIKMACVSTGFNLVIHKGQIGIVDKNKIIMTWLPIYLPHAEASQ